jgi:hypothetical protein
MTKVRYCPHPRASVLIVTQAPPTRPPRGLFGPLMQHLDSMHPVEFQLPEDVRTFFKDGECTNASHSGWNLMRPAVNTDSRGFYIDNSQIRHGRLE